MADMRYTSMSRDLSNDSVSTVRIPEYGNLDYPDKYFTHDTNSLNGPLLPNNINLVDKVSKERKDHREKFKVYRKYSELAPPTTQNGYDNFGNSVSCKSHSLPGRCNSNSAAMKNIVALNVQPEDLASQLTLLDLSVFKSIRSEELSSCSWNKKNKLIVAPNVVGFTRRFNHVSFWTVQEILNAPTPKQRAEILAHFIRVAKRLYELNNLHSLFAITSALQSASIYRLNKTWACISKKDKATFDKLAEVFSDKNNWMNLRDHMDSIKLPCIPYLGVFLTDLVFIDMAHPASRNGDNCQRILKFDAVLSRVKMFQVSEYPGIIPLPDVQQYLNSVRYIEELQKFLEDDHFKLSMKLEPNSPAPSSSSSKESVGDVTGVAALSLSPARGCAGSLRLHAASAATKFVPGHRKCRSLGTKFRSTSLPRNFHKQRGRYGSNLTTSGIFGKPTALPLEQSQLTVRHLLDDSVLEEPHLLTQILDLDQNSPGSPADAVNEDCSLLSRTRTLTVLPSDIDGSAEPCCSMQGLLRRKVILRDGRKPAVSTWQRYWVQLWASTIVYFSSKCFKGNDRSDFKREPHKMVSIFGWIAEPTNNSIRPDTFLLTDPLKGNVYKFRTSSSELADQWLKALRATVRGATEKKPIPVNLMSFE
ncbi:ras-specific guanine nucleotide-releasing factor RalGPS1 isoform X2 [Belonocnema kinseyi]|uniref:ras-specific guanine nucleotide-releasing factor RalGPS1 isoform X2 n=1 Tax=Belonocnema kinseyi TaxID=2817044 RepID=UPI00143D0824|nr:ras-specific guanine nucleotide-releasing factor RalGPS1 isoform X2 [Belonocnema kinseyi]